MKRNLYWLTGIAIVILLLGYLFTKHNNSSVGLETIDLKVDCSEITRLLVTSVVTVRVENLSSRSHDAVAVKISAFDKNGDFIKDKYTTFERSLEPNGSLSKPVTLPAKIRSCTCEIVSSQ